MLLAGVAAVVAGGAVVALAASSGTSSPPPPKPLADALHDALAAAQPAGVTARVTFTNNLLPSGALFGNAGSALLSGASGRLWMTNEGYGRIELQSDAGDVQIVWSPSQVSVLDASSNTLYKLTLPASTRRSQTDSHTTPTVAQISDFVTQLAQHLGVSEARPTVVGSRPAYDVSLATRQTDTLLGSLHLAWDAEQGVPLRAGLFAKGSATPALQLAVNSISYGPVPSSDVDIAPPAGAKVVDLGAPSDKPDASSTKRVTGLDAVKAGAGFGVVAPDALAGRARTQAVLAGRRVLLVYGKGPGAIVVVERKADATQGSGGMLDALPKVSLNGVTGHEVSTQLGTAITWQRGGVAFVLLGSVPSATAESATNDLA